MTDDKWERGQQTPNFNEHAVGKEPNEVEKPDHQERPPTLGLHGGPPPPGHVQKAADEAARAQAAKERIFAKLNEKYYNEINDKDIGEGRGSEDGNDRNDGGDRGR